MLPFYKFFFKKLLRKWRPEWMIKLQFLLISPSSYNINRSKGWSHSCQYFLFHYASILLFSIFNTSCNRDEYKFFQYEHVAIVYLERSRIILGFKVFAVCLLGLSQCATVRCQDYCLLVSGKGRTKALSDAGQEVPPEELSETGARFGPACLLKEAAKWHLRQMSTVH